MLEVEQMDRYTVKENKYQPEYAISLNINKLRGISATEKGRYLRESSSELISICDRLEIASSLLFPDVLPKLGWGTKSITTGEPRDRIATTGT